MAPPPAADTDPGTGQGARRRSAAVDAALGGLAALPVLTVLLDSGDLFVLVAAALPVAVMLVCSFDPPDVGALATRLRDARRAPLAPPARPPAKPPPPG